MANRFSNRLKHAWNAFVSPTQEERLTPRSEYYGGSSSYRPDRVRFNVANEKSLVSSIFTRIGIDAAGVDVRHVRTDDDNRYREDIDSSLNECLTLSANLDQAARAFRQDLVMTLLDRGCVAVVPVDTTINPLSTGGYDILTMRVGWVTSWFPRHVRVSVYNDAKGIREEIVLPKANVAIIENPLYAVMNETSSTLQRLIRKLNTLDSIDKQLDSGKLDIIIQLPYTVKSESMRQKAQQRLKDIEFQLTGSQYGIAYADGSEKITQLNRPAENNLMTQVEYLTEMLYGELGITEDVMKGKADEETMLNYWSRTIEPILEAITEELKRTFLTKTARSQKQSIMYFRDVFKLAPLQVVAEAADKFARNEILTSNELRGVVGFKPAKDPKADKLINSNMPTSDTQLNQPSNDNNVVPIRQATQNG